MQVAGSLSTMPSLHCIAGSEDLSAHLHALQHCSLDLASRLQAPAELFTISPKSILLPQKAGTNAAAIVALGQHS